MTHGASKPFSDPSVNRRSFFRHLLLRGTEGLEQTGLYMVGKIGLAESARSLSAAPRVYLRPPGALSPDAFVQTCSQCGLCVEACPAQCIQLEKPINEQAQESGDGGADRPGGGLPYITARQSPCVVCDELACMNVCPTGALKLVERVDQIRMGIAEVDFGRCLRGIDGDQEDCRICVEQCPVGKEALAIGANSHVEVRAGCIGCGVCEWACPTQPASITVRLS